MCGGLCARIFIANDEFKNEFVLTVKIKKKNPADQSCLTASARFC